MTRTLALAAVALAALAHPAHAQLSVGTLYAEGLSRPAGFFPYAFTWPLDTGVWACDDTGVLPFAQAANGAAYLDRSHFAAPVASPGQPSVDSARQFVYLPEAISKSRGVWRATRDTNLDPSGRPILVGIIAQGKGLGGNRPTATALGPDGKLYVGFLKNGNIQRIVAPEAGFTQSVEAVGRSFKGGQVFGLAFVGNTLYLAGKDGFQAMASPTAATGGASASLVPGLPARLQGRACHGIVSDGVDYVYFECDGAIWRFSTQRRTVDLLANAGRLPDGSQIPFSFNGGSTAGLMLDPDGSLWVGTDPGTGANFQGRVWKVALPTP